MVLRDNFPHDGGSFDDAEYEELVAECKEELYIPEDGCFVNMVSNMNGKLMEALQSLQSEVLKQIETHRCFDKHSKIVADFEKMGEHLYEQEGIKSNLKQAQEDLHVLSKQVELIQNEKDNLTKDRKQFMNIIETINGLYSEAFEVNVEVSSVSADCYTINVGWLVNNELAGNEIIMTIDFKKKELINFDVESFCSPSEICEFRKMYEDTKSLPKLISMLRAKIIGPHECKKISK